MLGFASILPRLRNSHMKRLVIVWAVTVCLVASLPEIRSVKSEPKSVQSVVQIAGIKDRITIHRDERGIPYIEAKNDEDLYFGQGYATAADRLWQMDMFRRTARGELAEILGAGPNNLALDQDKLHRTYGFSQAAEAD